MRTPRVEVALAALAVTALAPGFAKGVESLAQQIEDALPPHVGAAVLVVDNSETPFKQGFGLRRLGETVPVDGATNFRLASITKHLTATCVMLLEEEGVLDLDATLDRFFPECPPYWHEITLHHLLCHTSGMPAYESLIPAGTALQLDDVDCLELLYKTDRPVFKPGSAYSYSNSGYVLSGLVVQQACGRPFHEFLRLRVFEPTGMLGTVAYVQGLNRVGRRAYGHARADGVWRVADQSTTSAMLGDGGVYSSLDDLEKWLSVLRNRELLSEASYDRMLSPHADDADHADTTYGYGWRIDRWNGEPRLMHNGGTRGFSHTLQRLPESGRGVVVLLNSESDRSMTEVGEAVMRVAFGG